MLERYLTAAYRLRRYRTGPFGSHIDALAAKFDEQGYSPYTARMLLSNVAHLSHYLLWRGIGRVEEMRPEHVKAFYTEHLPSCTCERPNSGAFASMPAAMRHLVQFLGERGLLHGFEAADPPPESVAGVLIRFETYLKDVRGLTTGSSNLHRRIVKRFLDARYNRLGALMLGDLTPAEVLEYSRESLATPYSPMTKRSIMACLRTFFRFLFWEHIQSRDLTSAVPSVMHWKLADVPKYLPWDKVRLLLNTPNVNTPMGKRDRAIMMLMALLGLRAGEVAALTLDHVQWRERHLTVPAAKASRQRTMPLPSEAAKVLADYLRRGRPKTRSRMLFVRHRAPIKALCNRSVGSIVSTHILQAGIKEPIRKGSHVLRHSLATCLINKGVPIKQISDILGHSSIQTTSIYAKVDVQHLAEVARPFPAVKEGH